MKCPVCKFDNRDGVRFCEECGSKLEVECPACNNPIPPSAKFCGECGHEREGPVRPSTRQMIESERKHVTILFSDLSGYTALTERLDPEEVKDIMNLIFGMISRTVTQYGGHIERLFGDEVMALFGIPVAHEDDPVRAIKAAMEIHDRVADFSKKIIDKVGMPLSMHSGIDSGLVVIGEFDFDKDRQDYTGSSINIASRISDLAKAGEILVSSDLYHQTEGYYHFQALQPTLVKGKSEAIPIYRVLAPKERPKKIYRSHGFRAKLIGREAEITQLEKAVDHLQNGTGSIVAISGEAGTGKSRLVEEFKAKLDRDKIRWIEGYAFAYTQNIPYFPLIDLLNRAFRIEESDVQQTVKEKMERRLKSLIGEKSDIIPYIGGLFSIPYPEVELTDPEDWKAQLHQATRRILSAVSRRAPTVICIEDLQWADPSSIELIVSLLLEFRYPVLFIFVYRTEFILMDQQECDGLEVEFHTIHLDNLSGDDERRMLNSLLESQQIPSRFVQFMRDKSQGNPFYTEEVVNSLVESKALVRESDGWKMAKPLSTIDIPISIHGILSARVDRLPAKLKNVLQEASAIGSVFDRDILQHVTGTGGDVGPILDALERLGFIRSNTTQPSVEYSFKHVMTQEVVYSRVLKKKRRILHEKIGYAIEHLFPDRLSEFYDILAFHFKKSNSIGKAIDYLMKSGETSLQKYALLESHQNYEQAFALMEARLDKKEEDVELIVDIILKWMLVFYFEGRYRDMTALIEANADLAQSLEDPYRLGMYSMWLGMTSYNAESFPDAHQHLIKALEIGEAIGNKELIGHTCTWLAYTCADMGRLDEAVVHGKRAVAIGNVIEAGYYPYHLSLGGLGFAYWARGESRNAFAVAEKLFDYGRKQKSTRAMVFGNWVMGFGYLVDGNYPKAIEYNQKAIEISADPWYAQFPNLHLGLSYAANGQFPEAEKPLERLITFCENHGGKILGTPAKGLLGVVLVANGEMSKGFEMLTSAKRWWREHACLWRYANAEYSFGDLYLKILDEPTPLHPMIWVKNIGFILGNVPFAARKAELHLKKAIDICSQIKAKGLLGHSYFKLGLLYKRKGKRKEAKNCIARAIDIFQTCEAETSLSAAKETLALL